MNNENKSETAMATQDQNSELTVLGDDALVQVAGGCGGKGGGKGKKKKGGK